MKKTMLLSGALASLSILASAQSTVSTNGAKNVLLEEFTNASVRYGPQADWRVDSLTQSDSRIIGVSFHVGSSVDSMKINDGNSLFYTYTSTSPTGMVDRAQAGTANSIAMSRNDWAAAITPRLGGTPDFDITLLHDFNNATGAIAIQVTAKALKNLTGDYNINVYVLEDSVQGSGTGWDQINAYNTTSGSPHYNAGDPIVGYRHMRVVRAMLGGPFGESGFIATNPQVNAIATKKYNYTLPATAIIGRYRLVAVIGKDNPANPSDRAISNAVASKLTPGKLTAETIIPAPFNVYPNPVSNMLHVTGTAQDRTELGLINDIGQIVISRVVESSSGGPMTESLDVSLFPAGTYTLTIERGDSTYTKRVLITP